MNLSKARADELLAAFRKTEPFPLDPFQVEAIRKLGTHHGVLVAAPTSSGKTVVADYAIFEALEDGARAIYTTPLKALSNQKFRDLKKKHGDGYVGLVTGEHSINELAPVVVMTTEILRNLIYEDPARLKNVRYVVLDEIHYIDDFPRGAVWEEIMIQAPTHIKFVGLSATISNHQELVDWMASHRGEMGQVVVTERPTELKLWLAMENQLHPLFDEHGKVVRRTWNKAQEEVAFDRRFPRRRNLDSNNMMRVIEELTQRQMVPAIYFIFSRRGCEEALQRCVLHRLDLTDGGEKARIDAFVKMRLDDVADADEKRLYTGLLSPEQLRLGLASHHAGMLPFVKELVEELFQQGLIKVVFATETLALGIHMPARAVVVSSFTKFDGRGFPSLTSGQLTQLMGRAGRRGIDTIGHGVIFKDAEVDIGVIYEAAQGEDMVVESKFAPTYNMALNLLRHRSIEEAELLMERSFGQFQRRDAADQRRRELGNMEERLADLTASPPGVGKKDRCTPEAVQEYFDDEARLRNIRNRSRRAKRQHWQGVKAGDDVDSLKSDAADIRRRHEESPVRRCPNLRAHRQWAAEMWELRDEIRRSREEIDGAMHDYKRHLRSIIAILEEAGFLWGLRPSEKGMLASRIYAENSLLLTEAIHEGWLEELDPAELCGVVVMLAAEDRGRGRQGGFSGERRFPTHAIAQTQRRLRTLHYRFTALEEEYGEATLRALSRDYVDFAYNWARGTPLTEIPLRQGVDFGDAVKAIKSLYSVLRQLEWAIPKEAPLRSVVYSALRAMERDLIRRV
ncbi:MAG: DEAD/DEAH box helicase [Candidatus Dormibacteria bacterium]